jgi:hypothetical protein
MLSYILRIKPETTLENLVKEYEFHVRTVSSRATKQPKKAMTLNAQSGVNESTPPSTDTPKSKGYSCTKFTGHTLGCNSWKDCYVLNAEKRPAATERTTAQKQAFDHFDKYLRKNDT